MSTYKEIRGLKVRDYTTNPDNPIEGQLWYNTTDNVAKYQIPNLLASWRTSTDLNAAEMYVAGAGTTSNSIVFGGSPQAPATPQLADTELWDGSTWTEVNNLNSARAVMAGAGIYTSALCFGGEWIIHDKDSIKTSFPNFLTIINKLKK